MDGHSAAQKGEPYVIFGEAMMGGSDIDGHLEWAKSVVAKTQSEREALYKEVGRLVVALSEIEYNLAIAFVSLGDLNEIEVAIKRFYAQPTFEKRVQLVEDGLKGNTWWGGDISGWYEFRKRLKKHQLIRNLVAHQAHGYSDGQSALVPSWLIKDRRGRALGIKDIKESADELEKLDQTVRRLHVWLGANDGVLGGYKPRG